MTETDEWMISFLDDHSRFVLGSEIHNNPEVNMPSICRRVAFVNTASQTRY